MIKGLNYKKSVKKIIVGISVCLLASQQIPVAFAQENYAPAAGIDVNYFQEGSTDVDYKKIAEIKEEIEIINSNLKGWWVYKKNIKEDTANDTENYDECVQYQKDTVEEAKDFSTVKPKKTPKKKPTASNTANKTTSTNTKPTTPEPGFVSKGIYYDNEKCFVFGFTNEYKFYEKQFKTTGCSLSELQSDFKLAGVSNISEYSKVCQDEFNKVDTENKNKKKTDTTKTKQKTAAEEDAFEKCKNYYANWLCSIAESEALLKQRKKQQLILQKLEHPELYKCQYSDDKGTINNTVCVEFTERLGKTKVIGAQSGIGLLKAYIAILYRYAAILVGVIAVFMIIYNGIKIATGGEEAVGKAKDSLTSALIGLAVLFLSGAILYIINPNFFTFT